VSLPPLGGGLLTYWDFRLRAHNVPLPPDFYIAISFIVLVHLFYMFVLVFLEHQICTYDLVTPIACNFLAMQVL
jgi:hypothetical protein